MVRIKIRIKFKNKEFETSTIVNTGYGTEEPEILLPAKLAEKIGIKLNWDTPKASYFTPNGEIELYSPAETVEVKASPQSPVEAKIAISSKEKEVIISDSLASALKIVIEDPFLGLWRFKGEKKERISEAPKFWL